MVKLYIVLVVFVGVNGMLTFVDPTSEQLRVADPLVQLIVAGTVMSIGKTIEAKEEDYDIACG
jgi:hypothetical protein